VHLRSPKLKPRPLKGLRAKTVDSRGDRGNLNDGLNNDGLNSIPQLRISQLFPSPLI
jgi:hypothetical protein